MNYKNYICIDGRKAELTPEQLKALGIDLKKAGPFKKVGNYLSPEAYFYIYEDGRVFSGYDDTRTSHNELFKVANYCTDKAMLEQRALHETLNRLLWRYSMERGGDKLDWILDRNKTRIVYSHASGVYVTESDQFKRDVGAVYFCSRDVALSAIKEVIEPFMEEHPEFEW